jgi:hypothetical protein
MFGAVKRLYLYSRRDCMVDWKDVERHAEEAEGKGWDVKKVLFDEGENCALVTAKKGAEKYWSAVKELWEDSRLEQQSQDQTVELTGEDETSIEKGARLQKGPIRSKL